MTAIVTEDPEAARRWVAGLGQSKLALAAVAEFVGQDVALDRGAAAKWITGLAAGAVRDCAAGVLLQELKHTPSNSIVIGAAATPPPRVGQARLAWLEGELSEVTREDLPLARLAIEALQSTNEERARLLKLLELKNK